MRALAFSGAMAGKSMGAGINVASFWRPAGCWREALARRCQDGLIAMLARSAWRPTVPVIGDVRGGVHDRHAGVWHDGIEMTAWQMPMSVTDHAIVLRLAGIVVC